MYAVKFHFNKTERVQGRAHCWTKNLNTGTLIKLPKKDKKF